MSLRSKAHIYQKKYGPWYESWHENITLGTFPAWKLIIIKLSTSKIYLMSLLIPSEITPHNYSARLFQSFRSLAETQHLRFKSNNNESYNNPFSIEELTDAISKAHYTAVGPDDIHNLKQNKSGSNTCPRRLCKRFLRSSMTFGSLVISPTHGVRLLSYLFQSLVKTNQTHQTIVLSL